MSGERIETAGEYAPTTDEVRAVWMEWSEYGGLTNRPASTDRTGRVAEFDRWLAQVAAEMRAQIVADLRTKFGLTNRAADYLSRKEHDRG